MHEMLVLASLATVFLVLIISPGPNFLVITQITISQSRLHGIFAGLGVASGSALWATLAATGLGLLFASVPGLQPALQAAGGAYLIHVGIKIWRGARNALGEKKVEQSAYQYLGQAYRYGLTTNLTNPKALAFYTSVFSSLLQPGLASWVKPAAVLMIAALAVTWFTTLATLFSVASVQTAYRGAKFWIDRVTGAFLFAFGLHMLSELPAMLGWI